MLAAIRDLLRAAIRQAIGSSQRVAVAGSGGIDSSVLLALTNEIMKERDGSVIVVAMDFGSLGDDRPHLRALEEHLGCEVVRVPPSAGKAYLWPTHEGVDAAPAVWPFSGTELALRYAARDNGADRILTGLGGDDLFDGDPRSLSAMLSRHPIEAVQRARSVRGFSRPRFPTLQYLVRPRLVPFVPRRFRLWRAARQASLLDTPWSGPLLRNTAERLTTRSRVIATAPAHEHTGSAYFDLPWQRFLAWLLHQEQRSSVLDRYDPILSSEMTSLLARVPAHLLLAGGQRRGLLREVARGLVPDSVLDREDKAAFAPAFAEFFAAAGGAKTFGEALEGRMLARLDLADATTFRREVTRALDNPVEDGRYGLAWAAMATESFLLRNPGLV